MHVFFAMAAIVLAAGTPADQLLDKVERLSDKATAEAFKEFIHPDKGLTVDVAPEGASRRKWVLVTGDNVKSRFAEALAPLFDQGLFKSSRYCKKEKGKEKYLCTLITPASLPRICEIEAREGKWYMVRIAWISEDRGEEEDDDDGLPL